MRKELPAQYVHLGKVQLNNAIAREHNLPAARQMLANRFYQEFYTQFEEDGLDRINFQILATRAVIGQLELYGIEFPWRKHEYEIRDGYVIHDLVNNLIIKGKVKEARLLHESVSKRLVEE